MRRLGLLLLVCLALAGCGALSDQTTVHTRLADAGYTNVSTFHGTNNGTDRFEVSASSSDQEKTTEQLAEAVWNSYPQHVDQLTVTLNGTSEVYSAEQLQQAFGDRHVTVKPDDDAATDRTILTWLAVAAGVFLLLVTGAVVLVVVLVRRSRRRKQQPHQVYLANPPPGWPPAA
ncbi:hypothetical protein BBK82_26765 [Lentzea guizhouensis]|uniref:DUF3153 domain-containing protein n=1 Tax=Lentzea guizhouensis TaxID=1586287 RepID=A0A1B2HN44_9PSEU|nr:hypothetical protein [Lentzea guizhouensis]ANZ39139.1 hypothetical protein BBK82_26765 [Lentzea guizhouensis]